jgi:uncharacterized protein
VTIEITREMVFLYAALAAAGIASGFINTMAGGGSLLTLPALMALGLPAHIANGTNRLSVVAQSISGVMAFHEEGKLDTKAVFPIAFPTIAGALAGAAIAAVAPEEILEPVLLGTMIAMALLMVIKPKLAIAGEGEEPRSPFKHPASLLGLFGAGLYGGFIQAGVGFVLIAVLSGLMRYDAVRANALKLVCTLLFGIAALGVFVFARQVEWVPAVVLAIATVIGSRLGVRFSVKVSPKVLHGIILVAVVATCVAAFSKR